MIETAPAIRTLIVLIALAAPSLPVAAQSDVPLRDYVHTVWTHIEGVPLGSIVGIVQTNDGYLWVTSRTEGLLRFDGMRFVRVSTPCIGPQTSVTTAPDGGFWLDCGSHLVRRTARGDFAVTPQSVPLPAGRTVLVDRLGRPWFVGARLIRYFEPDGTGGGDLALPAGSEVLAAAHDAEGTLWVSDGQHVVRMHADGNEEVLIARVECLAPAQDGGVFAVTNRSVWHLRSRTLPTLTTAPPGVTFSNVDKCLSDARDGLWVGTRQHGIALLRDGRVESSSDSSRHEPLISRVFVDREGTVWAGSPSGLHRFRRPMVQVMGSVRNFSTVPYFVLVDSRQALWTSPTEREGVTRVSPNGGTLQFAEGQRTRFVAIGEDETGRVWLSNAQDIGYVANRRFVSAHAAAKGAVSGVWAFTQDRRGHLWALADGVGVYRVTPGPPRLVVPSPRAASRFLVSARFGTWIAMNDGGVEQHVDGRINVFPDHDTPLTILEVGDSIWTGSFSGLRRWRHGTWTTWTRQHGLPGDGSVKEMIADQFGQLWMMTGAGLMRLSRAQLDATPDGSPRALSFALIGSLDFVPHPGNMRSSPRVSSDRRGRLFFTTMDSIVTVDSSAVTESSFAPPIALEAVTIDNRAIDHTIPQTFVEPSRLQFDYTSLNLRSPETARFRYRLDGYDADWIEAGGQRHVTYGTLRPGEYRFRVIGAGSEGVWNEAGASFAFQIRPVFWRTWWFRVMLFGFGSLIVAGLYQLRVRQLRYQFSLGLEARVGERTRIARELHDTLLQTFQGVLIHFQAATNLLPGRPDDAKHRLDRVLDQAALAIAEGRDAVQALRSSAATSDDLAQVIGLLGERLVGDGSEPGATAIRVHVEGSPRSLRPIVRDDLLRIAGEAMRNAVRHAQAQLIQVDIHYDERLLRVRIRDDGQGIDATIVEGRDATGHWGLPGMRERAELLGGTLEVRSRLQAGTEIDVSIPAAKAYAASPGRRGVWLRRNKKDANS